MFAVMLNDEKTILLADATSVEVNDNKEYVKFFDRYKNLIALFKLGEIKGFTQWTNTDFEEDV